VPIRLVSYPLVRRKDVASEQHMGALYLEPRNFSI
jgi:hypothetical protein